ncbi:sulfate ABC transporter ATP-binding protein [Afifella sp. H1R]|uniref:sulfate/molybdate ABC transporter ATP-binding protein n=1 Tax=Afifella sp. H1R TaxID=2908841 RepID=UPI001F3E5C3D|nr:sulfate ABC transporter ATP-binding protein [Afifella sp. H1R]MCF1503559.1 sulfate ABC transporter ATP-binding protein [Afifella sp. H1R]
MDIVLQNISKAFDDYPAVHDISLAIRSGELIALLGPSGSGKTTLLRLIAGLEFLDRGRILFGEEDASAKSVQERNVGFVFQHYALFKQMNVADNVGFGLRVRPRASRPGRTEIRRRALELLDLVQLSGLEKRFPMQLSGGQRQRVALARALAIEPAVLLLDEPFGALDAKVRKELRRWLRDLHEQTGHTTVFVTHDQEEALELADRVVVMNAGRVEQVGTADEIYDAPASPFVHGFIGESSSLPVTLSGGAILVAGRPSGLVGAGAGAARLFFRPGHVEMLRPGERGIAGVVTGSRRLTDRRRLEIAVGGNHPVEIDVPSLAETSHGVETGSEVIFRPREFRLYGESETASRRAA